jgi:hypothetical protein
MDRALLDDHRTPATASLAATWHQNVYPSLPGRVAQQRAGGHLYLLGFHLASQAGGGRECTPIRISRFKVDGDRFDRTPPAGFFQIPFVSQSLLFRQ